jgi:hypothetical protein
VVVSINVVEEPSIQPKPYRVSDCQTMDYSLSAPVACLRALKQAIFEDFELDAQTYSLDSMSLQDHDGNRIPNDRRLRWAFTLAAQQAVSDILRGGSGVVRWRVCFGGSGAVHAVKRRAQVPTGGEDHDQPPAKKTKFPDDGNIKGLNPTPNHSQTQKDDDREVPATPSPVERW